jgi:hypothetical protein
LSKVAPDSLDGVWLESARASGAPRDPLGAVNEDPANLDASDPRESVNVREAECTSNVDLGIAIKAPERAPDVADLLLDAGDQLCLIAAPDPKDRASFDEQASVPVTADLAAVSLGVDDGHAPGSDGEVIDVRSTVAGYTAVMQEADVRTVEQLLQTGADADLAVAALLPGADAGWFLDHVREEPSEPSELLTRVLLARVVPTLVFAQCAGPCQPWAHWLKRSR